MVWWKAFLAQLRGLTTLPKVGQKVASICPWMKMLENFIEILPKFPVSVGVEGFCGSTEGADLFSKSWTKGGFNMSMDENVGKLYRQNFLFQRGWKTFVAPLRGLTSLPKVGQNVTSICPWMKMSENFVEISFYR